MEGHRQPRTAADEGEDVTIARRECEGESVVAIDSGGDVDARLDVVDGTAIVVAGDRQFEFEVPPEATDDWPTRWKDASSRFAVDVNS